MQLQTKFSFTSQFCNKIEDEFINDKNKMLSKFSTYLIKDSFHGVKERQIPF